MPGLSDSSLLLPQGPTGYYCKVNFLGQCPTSRDPIYTSKALESNLLPHPDTGLSFLILHHLWTPNIAGQLLSPPWLCSSAWNPNAVVQLQIAQQGRCALVGTHGRFTGELRMEAQKHQSSWKGQEWWGLFLLMEAMYTHTLYAMGIWCKWVGSCSPLLGFLSNVLDTLFRMPCDVYTQNIKYNTKM